MSTQPLKVEVILVGEEAKEYRPLSQLERACIQGIFEGKRNRSIAETLQTSEQAVRTALMNAYRKLQIESDRGLFPYVIAGNFEIRTGESVKSQ